VRIQVLAHGRGEGGGGKVLGSVTDAGNSAPLDSPATGAGRCAPTAARRLSRRPWPHASWTTGGSPALRRVGERGQRGPEVRRNDKDGARLSAQVQVVGGTAIQWGAWVRFGLGAPLTERFIAAWRHCAPPLSSWWSWAVVEVWGGEWRRGPPQPGERG